MDLQKLFLHKKGDVAFGTIVALVIGLIVLVIVIIFATGLKEKLVEGFQHFVDNILGR
jgi:hypothetical protein